MKQTAYVLTDAQVAMIVDALRTVASDYETANNDCDAERELAAAFTAGTIRTVTTHTSERESDPWPR